MHAETFLKEFASLANGPSGIQKLRELVLQLAVRGRLMPQSASDGHASDVAEKAFKESPIKVKKQLVEADQPHPIPANWAWVTLGAISNYGETEKVEPGALDDPNFWVLELEDVEKSTSRLLARVPFRERDFRSSKNRFAKGQVLYGKLRPYLDKVIVADRDGCCTTEIVPFSVFGGIDPYFIRWCMKTPDFISYADGSTYGMNLPRMGTKSAIAASIPLPPLAEQKRIVAKVDELMALCDELEARQAEETGLKRAAAASTLHHLTEAKTPEETTDRWSLLAPRFSELFDDLETIKALRDAIVRAACAGAVSDNRERSANADYAPFPIPSDWKWKKLGDLLESVTSGSRGWSQYFAPHGDQFIRSQDIKFDRVEFEDPVFVQLPGNVEGTRTSVRSGDLLLTITGANTGKCARVQQLEKAAFVSQHVALLRPKNCEHSPYLHIWLTGNWSGREILLKDSYGIRSGLNLKQIRELPVPFPRLAEQQHIVAKVDELMTLCDRLEEQVREGERLNAELMASLVNSLTETGPKGGSPAAETAGRADTTPASPATRDDVSEQSGSTSAGGVRSSESEGREVPTGPSDVVSKFKEAVLVGAIIKAFFTGGGEPIGNFRLQKAVYFARRHNGEHVGQMEYLKKAAGPYSPSMKYSGGIAIAKQKKWLHEARGRFGFGHVLGPAAGDMDEWIAKYGYGDPARWVAEQFRFKKNEEWETIATVDYAMEHLQSLGIEADAEQILQYIRADDEWRPKVEKLGLTEISIEAAMVEVRALFGARAKERVA